MTNVQSKLSFRVWPLGHCVQRTLGHGGHSGGRRPFGKGSVGPAGVGTCGALAFACTQGTLGLGNAVGFAGLGEGSSGCSSTCSCWHCCSQGLGKGMAVSWCQHKPLPAQELVCCRRHKPGSTATEQASTSGSQRMSCVFLCPFQYK